MGFCSAWKAVGEQTILSLKGSTLRTYILESIETLRSFIPQLTISIDNDS